MTPNTNFNTKYQGIVFITYFRTSSSVFQVPLLIGGHLIFRLMFLTTTSSVCRLCFAFVAVLFVLGIEEKCFLRHHLWKRYSLKIYFDFSEIKTGWRQFSRKQQSKKGKQNHIIRRENFVMLLQLLILLFFKRDI